MGLRLDDVVAERRVDAISDDGSTAPVRLAIGRPRPDSQPGGDWECPHQILGLGDDSVGTSHGVDSLQAFLLSVWTLELKLTERAAAASARLEWLGSGDLDLHVIPDIENKVQQTGVRYHSEG